MEIVNDLQIEKAVRPILEKMGLYRGNEVSAKDLFEKYILAFPQGIKPLWKFQIIVKHELNIHVKSLLFDGPDEIYIFSQNIPKRQNWKNPFIPSWIGRFYCIFSDEDLVGYWLSIYEDLYEEFENRKNKLSHYVEQHEKIARYWLQHGEHDTTSANPVIVRGQKKWDQFIEKSVYWGSKAGEHTVRRWLC